MRPHKNSHITDNLLKLSYFLVLFVLRTTPNVLSKLESHLAETNCAICSTESPLKMMKNVVYFILKAIFVLKICKFLSWLFRSCSKIGLIREIRLTSKLMKSQTGYQTMTIYIFPNISRCKSNQTMKLDQLIEYNKRNIFLQNYMENEVGRLVPDLLLFFRKT